MEEGHHREASPVVFMTCGDYRISNLSINSVAELIGNLGYVLLDKELLQKVVLSIGESMIVTPYVSGFYAVHQGVYTLAKRLGFATDISGFNFDMVASPGPAQVLSKDGSKEEGVVLRGMNHAYVSLHGGELVIVSAHFDCGREGDCGQDKSVLYRHLFESCMSVRDSFLRRLKMGHLETPVTVAGMFIDMNATTTIGVNGYSMDELANIMEEYGHMQALSDYKILVSSEKQVVEHRQKFESQKRI